MNYNDVTILILSYEPNDVLVRIAKEFKEASFDVLIVNDGSKKEFDNIFEDAKKYAEVLSYKKNHGKGYAIRYGVNHLLTSKKEQKYVITVDGDGQHVFKDVVKVTNKLKETNEIVLATRIFKKDVPFRSKFGNMWSKFTQTMVTDKYISDNQCGLRGFPLDKAEFLLAVPGNRYEYEMNVISTIFMRDLSYKEVEIEAVYEKGNPTSHFSPFIDTCRIQGMLLIYGFAFFVALAIQFVFTGIFMNILNSLPFNFHPILVFLASFGFANYNSYLIFAGLNTVVYRPRRPYYHIIRCLYISILEFMFIAPITILFSFVLPLHYALSFVIALLIALFPTYFILRWINKLMKKFG